MCSRVGQDLKGLDPLVIALVEQMSHRTMYYRKISLHYSIIILKPLIIVCFYFTLVNYDKGSIKFFNIKYNTY